MATLCEFELREIALPYRFQYGHAAHQHRGLRAIVCVARDESGRVGLGEAVPRTYVTGETCQSILADAEWVATFEKPKTSPNVLEPSTTVLSPYLKFGCLSPRLFYTRLAAAAYGGLEVLDVREIRCRRGRRRRLRERRRLLGR